MAYVRDDAVSFKGSTSALPNNLSIIPSEKDNDIAIINRSTAHLVRLDERCRGKSQADLKYKDSSEDKLVNITQVSILN